MAGFVVIAFLTITVICSVSISRKHVVRRDIIHKIDILDEQEIECVFKLSDVTKFRWDKVERQGDSLMVPGEDEAVFEGGEN